MDSRLLRFTGSGHIQDMNTMPVQPLDHLAGVRRCITSFVDLYAKVRTRIAAMPGVEFEDPPMYRVMLLSDD